MSSPRLAGDDLPGWPRLLDRDQAAAYAGLSPNAFDAEVSAGTFPAPFPLGRVRRNLWDKRALDAVMDRASGLAGGAHDWQERKRRWQEQRQG